VLNEPVICISTINQKTCDPCCLVSVNCRIIAKRPHLLHQSAVIS
jgi:hypothetical protein